MNRIWVLAKKGKVVCDVDHESRGLAPGSSAGYVANETTWKNFLAQVLESNKNDLLVACGDHRDSSWPCFKAHLFVGYSFDEARARIWRESLSLSVRHIPVLTASANT